MLSKLNFTVQQTFSALLSAAVLAAAMPAVAQQTPAQNKQAGPPTPAPALTPEQQEMGRLFDMGNQERNKADLAAAARTFQAGLDKAEALKNEKYIALFSSGLGDVSLDLKQYEKARDYYNRALLLSQKRGNSHNIPVIFQSLGTVYFSLGQLDKALDSYQSALPFYQKPDSSKDSAVIFHNIGTLYFRMRQFDKALDNYKSALKMYENSGNTPGMAHELSRMGNASYDLGQQDNALAYLKRALDIEARLGNLPDAAANSYEIALIYTEMGSYQDAVGYNIRALAMLGEAGDQYEIARNFNNLGVAYDSLGQYGKALDCHNRALGIRQKLGNSHDVADSLLNLGSVFYSLSQHDRALDYFQRTLVIRQKLGEQEETADCLNNLGAVCLSLGQNDKALDYDTRALVIHKRLGSQQKIAASLNNVGAVYGEMGRFTEALNCLREALAASEQGGNSHDIALSLGNLSVLYFRMGRFDEALECCNRTLSLFGKHGNLKETVRTYKNLGDVYTGMGQLDKAQAAFNNAIQQYESLSEQVGDPDQVGALQAAFGLYARNAALRLRQQRPGEALTLLERGRAQGLARQLAQSRVNYTALFTPQDAVRWQTANKALGTAEKQLGNAERRLKQAKDQANAVDKDKAATPPQMGDVTAELTAQQQCNSATQRDEEAGRQLSSLRVELQQRYPQFRRLSGTEPPTPIQLAALARRNPDTLYLQWAVTEKETLLLALGQKDGVKGFRVPLSAKALKDKAHAWRNAIETYGKLVKSFNSVSLEEEAQYSKKEQQEAQREIRPARALYHVLFDPLAKAGLLAPNRYRRLVLVGDGPLLDLPLAALVTGADNKKPRGSIENTETARLLDRYAVSTTISFGVLTWPGQPNGKADQPLFCVADTAGGTAPERFPTMPAENVTPTGSVASPGGSAKTDAAGRRVVGSLLRGGYDPLPEARQEGHDIVGMFPGAMMLAGPSAREEVVRKEMGHADLLHFAVHGSPISSNPLNSWLLLAEEEENSPFDGRLEAREVASMKLTARMTVLSACESGRGQRRGGDGLIGMAWAFRGAGCPSVVATQWQVNDTASHSLMRHFYRNLKAGQRKDAALQRAMQAVRREKGHQAPFWWAGFEVIGDATSLFAKPASVAPVKGKVRRGAGA